MQIKLFTINQSYLGAFSSVASWVSCRVTATRKTWWLRKSVRRGSMRCRQACWWHSTIPSVRTQSFLASVKGWDHCWLLIWKFLLLFNGRFLEGMLIFQRPRVVGFHSVWQLAGLALSISSNAVMRMLLLYHRWPPLLLGCLGQEWRHHHHLHPHPALHLHWAHSKTGML